MRKFPVAWPLYSVRNDMGADFEGTLKAVAAMGCKYIALPYYDRNFGPDTETCERFIASVKTPGRAAKEQDMPSTGKSPMECVVLSREYLKSLDL